MSAYRVGVVRGGPSSEYEVSLKTGGHVLSHLPEHYQGVDILVTRDGAWHLGGLPTRPERAAGQVDVIFNALHGEYGEDGRVQNILEHAGVPYTGSNTFASAVGMNKPLAKEIFRRHGLRVPFGLVLRDGEVTDAAHHVFQKISPPWVVKPADRGSSLGTSLARTFRELEAAIAHAFSFSKRILVEEYIRGREATCGVINHFRNKEIYALPPIEIRKPGQEIWKYDDKYNGQTEEICPSHFSSDEKMALEKLAAHAHSALGLRHYSRADFIVSPRGIYLLEVNSLPGMTAESSLWPKALQAVGCSYPDFLDHVITLALERR